MQDHDEAWPTCFEALAARARIASGDLVLRVEHVGSTAVPGLAAKPVVDLDVVVASRAEVPEAIRRLARIGYVRGGDLGIAGREAFFWPPGEERHHLYVLADGAAELRRRLAFRDALRADTVLRDAHAGLKRSFAAKHADDGGAYTAGKSSFVVAALGGR